MSFRWPRINNIHTSQMGLLRTAHNSQQPECSNNN